MKEELEYIGRQLLENKDVLAKQLEKELDEDYIEQLKTRGLQVSEQEEFRQTFIQYAGEALLYGPDHVSEKVTEWAENAAVISIQYGSSLTDALRAAYRYRRVIWNLFAEELEKQRFASITMLDTAKIVDPIIDIACRVIGDVYEKHNTRQMTIAHTALEELSVPVVPIAEGIAVIPLIGEIDTHRANTITEQSLKKGTDLNLDYLILDVSGVQTIDTMVTNEIFQILKALSLIGVEGVITGIRPEIAQSIGNLGLTYEGVNVSATLQQALETLGFKQGQGKGFRRKRV